MDWALSGDGVFLNIRCGPSPKIGNRRKCGGFPLVSSFSYVFYLLFLLLLDYCWEVYTLEGGEGTKIITLQKSMGSVLTEQT